MKVIAVDFDGTLCEERWPKIGRPRRRVIRELKRRQAKGDRIILWTCREGKLLDEAVLWCLERGIVFDAINGNVPERIRQYGDDPRKLSADEYWDDRAVVPSFAAFAARRLRRAANALSFFVSEEGRRQERTGKKARTK